MRPPIFSEKGLMTISWNARAPSRNKVTVPGRTPCGPAADARSSPGSANAERSLPDKPPSEARGAGDGLLARLPRSEKNRSPASGAIRRVDITELGHSRDRAARGQGRN